MATPEQLTAGLWRWASAHPEWSAGAFGAEVASFALDAGEELLLVDPLVPAEEPEPVLMELDRLAGGRAVHVLITLGYHVRSADALGDRYDAELWGPPAAARRLRDPARMRDLAPGVPGPAGVRAFAVGSPPRGERPLWLPSHAAVAFGDAVVTTPEGELRLWEQEPVTQERRRFYAERFVPTLAPLVELGPLRILVTHGAPVLEDGAERLRTALVTEPWHHRG